jgi:hypothetical protein
MNALRIIVWDQQTLECVCNKTMPDTPMSQLIDYDYSKPYEERYEKYHAHVRERDTLPDGSEFDPVKHFRLILDIDDVDRPDLIKPTVHNQSIIIGIFKLLFPEIHIILRHRGSSRASCWLHTERAYRGLNRCSTRSGLPYGEEKSIPFLPGGNLLMPEQDERMAPKEMFKALVCTINTIRVTKAVETMRAINALASEEI